MLHNTVAECVTTLPVCAALTFNRGKLPALLLSALSQVGRPAEINIATVSKKPVPPLWGDTSVHTHTHGGCDVTVIMLYLRHARQTHSHRPAAGFHTFFKSLPRIIMRHARTNCSCSPVCVVLCTCVSPVTQIACHCVYLPHMGNTGTSTLRRCNLPPAVHAVQMHVSQPAPRCLCASCYGQQGWERMLARCTL